MQYPRFPLIFRTVGKCLSSAVKSAYWSDTGSRCEPGWINGHVYIPIIKQHQIVNARVSQDGRSYKTESQFKHAIKRNTPGEFFFLKPWHVSSPPWTQRTKAIKVHGGRCSSCSCTAIWTIQLDIYDWMQIPHSAGKFKNQHNLQPTCHEIQAQHSPAVGQVRPRLDTRAATRTAHRVLQLTFLNIKCSQYFTNPNGTVHLNGWNLYLKWFLTCQESKTIH